MPVSINSRYYGLETIEHGRGTGIVQRPPPGRQDYPDSILHTLVGGETLDELAFRYYGREDLWWRIADANPGIFSLDWQAGDTLVIPPPRVVGAMPRR